MSIMQFTGYRIEEDGTVFSLIRNRPLKPSPQLMKGKDGTYHESGYLFQTLLIDGEKKRMPIHRIVCMHYHPNPDNKPWVNHKDNLEWSSISENIQHSFDSLGRKGSRHMLGKNFSIEARLNMSKAKRGIRHPKFSGYFCSIGPCGEKISKPTAKELTDALGLRIHPVTVSKKCKASREGFWFEPVEKAA